MKPIRIVIFAKAPLEGFAKTRLISRLGEVGAALLAKKLLQHTVEQAIAANVGPVELCVTPGMGEFDWHALDLPKAHDWSEQVEGDLGVRMASAAMRIINAQEPILLMGTDCPALDSQCIQMAACALHSTDACIVPVSDGGYALLGLNKYHPLLFSDIPWSTNKVTMLTKQRLNQLSMSLVVLESLHDIDEPNDLQWLPNNWDEYTAR